LAAALERAGAVRSGGRPYSPDQLRADVSRLKRRRNLTGHLPRPSALSRDRGGAPSAKPPASLDD
jgi:hypothetical protein